MGLDMFLKAERYVAGDEFHPEASQALYARLLEAAGLDRKTDVEPSTPSATVSFTIGYWRKANAIHAWFVRVVQGGEDESRPHHVEREQLEELARHCRAILKNEKAAPLWQKTANELLPPQAGFFFGSTDLDEGYLADVRDTLKIMKRCLSPKFAEYSFIYRSSW